jgi:flagellar motor switch protein FliN
MRSSLETLLQQFAESISTCLSQALGTPWDVTPCADSCGETAVARFAVSTALRGGFSVRMPRRDANRLVGMFLGNAVGDDEWNAERQDAFEELARQIVGELQTRVAADFGKPTFKFVSDGFTAMPDAETRGYQAINGDSKRLLFEIGLTAEFVASVRELDNREAAANDQAGTKEESLNPSVANASNLGLLMDVQLAATLRFGQRRMTLREILELSSGAVIELDRQVHEPVELLLDGKVIALGELVVVDGSYGIRVRDVGTMVPKARRTA